MSVSSSIITVGGWAWLKVIKGGIGHNLPQEAPREFAQAVIDVTRLQG
jgi:hypothetical protein